MRYRVTVPPAFEPVTLDEAQAHLRSDDDVTENATITALITAAREYCEAVTRRALATQTIEAYPERFGRCIDLPMPPLQSITSIKYTDSAGDEHVVADSDYVVDTVSGRICFSSPPCFAPYPINPIKITYIAGCESAPQSIKQAMLLLVGHWYINREAVSADIVRPVALAVDSLLSVHKVGWF
jgi:uncharacterized phiE125 gp8 family phage protein